jgi:hypothetical protein
MTIERYIDDKPDLDPRMMRPSTILQALSPAVAPGSDWPDARPGDIMLSFEDGSEKLVPRVPGVTFLPVVCVEKAVEWPPERGTRSAPVDHHDYVPLDALWLVGDDGRKSCRRPNGNRIEKTVFVHALVDGFKTTFAFKSTAYNSGQSFSRDADKARAEVDGEIVRVCVALWRMTSELERKQAYTWYGPRFTKLGALGEKNGPSLELVRMAKTMRFEFKAEEEKRKAERAALSAVKPTPALTRGTISITSGIERPRSWADPRPAEIVDPKPAAQPDKTVDPKLNDGLDDLPF